MIDLPDVHPALAVSEGEENLVPEGKFRERRRSCLGSWRQSQNPAAAR